MIIALPAGSDSRPSSPFRLVAESNAVSSCRAITAPVRALISMCGTSGLRRSGLRKDGISVFLCAKARNLVRSRRRRYLPLPPVRTNPPKPLTHAELKARARCDSRMDPRLLSHPALRTCGHHTVFHFQSEHDSELVRVY